LFGVAQPEHARDEEPRAGDEPVVDQDHAPLGPRRDGLAAHERREVEDAVEVAAHVRHATEPRMRARHRQDRGRRDHLVHLVQRHEPVVRADLEPELRGERRARRGGADPLGDGQLELAKAGESRHGVSRAP